MKFPKVAKLRTADQLREHLSRLGVEIPFDDALLPCGESPLRQPFSVEEMLVGNRFSILPMEGWDAERDGSPTELTRRRWRRFGESGAKLIWGGEAVAVRHDGRANPNQLLLNDQTASAIESLREDLEVAHSARFDSTADLLVGLQLTHSGRFARPNDKARIEPRTAYRHPLLDRRVGIQDNTLVFSDQELDYLVDDFIAAAKRAETIGFRFVDIKHCHGYLGHELLSGYDRPGKYGGDFVGRTRFLRKIVEGVRSEAPSLAIGVRISMFDFLPFHPSERDQVGEPDSSDEYRYAFGGDGSGLGIDLSEPSRFLSLLEELDIRLVCTTAGSPYYNPHIQRPAAFPPSDGYQPPEDPLVGVARQINVTAQLKQMHPGAIVVGSGYSYLQDWLPHVAQAVIRHGMADAIGLGRMVLSYHDLPADVLEGNPGKQKQICRTFSDCTTAPRNGMVSGCYPLDPFYKQRPERQKLMEKR